MIPIQSISILYDPMQQYIFRCVPECCVILLGVIAYLENPPVDVEAQSRKKKILPGLLFHDDAGNRCLVLENEEVYRTHVTIFFRITTDTAIKSAKKQNFRAHIRAFTD